MQIIPILISLVLISIVEATFYTRIPKPKLNLMHSQHFKNPEIPKHKLPEERRKLSLFPKNYIKYVVSSKPLYKIATHKPIIHSTRKPLMKKFILQDKRNIADENEIKQPNIKLLYDNDVAVIPKVEPVVIEEEVSIEIIEEKSEESDEIPNIEEKDESQNDNNEFNITTANTGNTANSDSLMDIIIPPNSKPVEVTTESKSEETFSDVSDIIKTSKEDEMPDLKEFIFIDQVQKRTEIDNISGEEPEEYVTEMYEEPIIFRRKRSSNIIEEENLASTVAGYKYTWKDTRLNNDLAFKNINS